MQQRGTESTQLFPTTIAGAQEQEAPQAHRAEQKSPFTNSPCPPKSLKADVKMERFLFYLPEQTAVQGPYNVIHIIKLKKLSSQKGEGLHLTVRAEVSPAWGLKSSLSL